MKVSEIIKKPVVEAKYLNVDNTDRYRPIIRLFYLKYEKLKYWLYQEEVFEELKEDTYFKEYTIEQCKQDLKTLTEWGNLLAMQDTRRAATLEEFANKKFRYQLSETAVEIERMVIRIENLFIESSSLEPSLLERIRMSLLNLPSMLAENDEKLYSYWNDLNNDFKRLNQNYQDYMRELFVNGGNKESEVVKVFDTTNEIIRKITGYAARISESGGSSANRKEEYKKLAEVFYFIRNYSEIPYEIIILRGMHSSWQGSLPCGTAHA